MTRQRQPSLSVLDILASGGSANRLPPGPLPEELDHAPLPLLPASERGWEDQEAEWIDASLAGHVEAGQARLRKKDYTGARSSFGIAKTLDPDQAEPRIGLIQTALLSRNYYRATQMIRQLGRRVPEAFATPFDIATWHESQEAYDAFLRRFRAEIVDDTKAGEMVRVLMGYVAWTNGDREQALNHMRQAAAQVSHEEAWVNMIQVLETPRKARQPAPTTATASDALPPL